MLLHSSLDRRRGGFAFLAQLTLSCLACSPLAAAAVLCVNPGGHHGCYSSIQMAVNKAAAHDVIDVAAGRYGEDVTIGIPLSLIGAGANRSTIDATGLAHGIFVDGVDHPGLAGVTIDGFTVQNALYEGILTVSVADVTIRNNSVLDNDKSPGLVFTGATTGCPGQPGTGVYENDETGDCGGAVHLVGTAHSIVDGNFISGNADGILISDETAESHDNVLSHDIIKNNPLECGIVLGSHPPRGAAPPSYAPHYGVDHNVIAANVSEGNGVQVGGSGVGIFSDGNGPGRVSDNVVIHNVLIGNGLGGVALHSHVGPSFGAPADDMSGNKIIGNFIARNHADTADTATPGTVGININSGGGGSPVLDTIISENVIAHEQLDIAVNTPAEVDVHLNDLQGGNVGVADVCEFDMASACVGTIDATENYWGCPAGPGGHGCTTTSGTDIAFDPWLQQPQAEDSPHDRDSGH
jgi:hypothetical protein